MGFLLLSHMERTALCPSTGPQLNYTPWGGQSWEGVPVIPVVRPTSLHPTQHPTPVRCNPTLQGSDRQDAPTHLQTPPLFPPTQSSSHRAPFPNPVSPVAPSTPPPPNAPLPRGQGRGHPTSLTRPSRRHQMTFTAGQVPCGPHYTSAGSRAPPHPRRTAPTSSPRSAASPPASAASAGGGPGGGRGGASRTARWPPGLVVPLVEPRGAMRPRLDSTSQEATQGAGSRLARPTRPRASWP